MQTHTTTIQAFGLEAVANGYSIIPINRETKRPYFQLLPLLYDEHGEPVMKRWTNLQTGEVKDFHARGWKPYQSLIATPEEIEYWTNRGAQLAVVCGAVSGGLLIIDFDEEGFFLRWMRACKRAGLDLSPLPIQRTGGGGWQVMLNCDRPGENQKLAWVKDDTQRSGRSVAIETRAEGGYAVIAPSLHPTGNHYVWRRHTLTDAPHVEQSGVDTILDIARSLSEVEDKPLIVHTPHAFRDISAGESVIDTYNQRADIAEVLLSFGYTLCGERLHRPSHERLSQPSVQIKDNRSWHWSSNDLLSDGYWKTPFEVRCRYDFDGDVTKAVRAIATELGMCLVRPVSAAQTTYRDFVRSASYLTA